MVHKVIPNIPVRYKPYNMVIIINEIEKPYASDMYFGVVVNSDSSTYRKGDRVAVCYTERLGSHPDFEILGREELLNNIGG